MIVHEKEEGIYEFKCPACGVAHAVKIGRDALEYNGHHDAPTFWPSVALEVPSTDGVTYCHFFVVGGRITYLDDCTHRMVGQRMKLPKWELPE